MAQKENTDIKPIRFYKKAIFPYMLILIATTLAIGFIAGWHAQSNYNQDMEQQYLNGAASVKPLEK